MNSTIFPTVHCSGVEKLKKPSSAKSLAGREESNLQMAGIKIAWLFNGFNGHLKKTAKMP